jgi:hypothetical protein
MSGVATFLVLGAPVAAIFLLQWLATSRKGSEESVERSLAQVRRGAWTFVAMQYYGGILNRTYLVFVTDELVCGAKVKGVIGAPAAPDARWKNPLFYVSPTLAGEYAAMDVTSAGFLRRSRANFRIARGDIVDATFSEKPKWGMGSVPSSGRIFLRYKNGKTTELILLGTQDGNAIRDRLRTYPAQAVA